VNSFLTLADRQISAPRKARHRAAEKRALRKVHKDDDQLRRGYAEWRRERRDAFLNAHRQEANELFRFLAGMQLTDGPALLELLGPWRFADPSARAEVLSVVDAAITKLRERNGFPPFDDSLPWSDELPRVFELARKMLHDPSGA
jgi:hypothetical protein